MQRPYRLCRKSDFVRLRRHGQRFSHALAVLIVSPQETNPSATVHLELHSRFAFSANKRVGNAVRRNRAKRLMREAVRLHLPAIKPERNCLFVAKPSTPDARFRDVETAVLHLLRVAKLLAPEERLMAER